MPPKKKKTLKIKPFKSTGLSVQLRMATERHTLSMTEKRTRQPRQSTYEESKQTLHLTESQSKPPGQHPRRPAKRMSNPILGQQNLSTTKRLSIKRVLSPKLLHLLTHNLDILSTDIIETKASARSQFFNAGELSVAVEELDNLEEISVYQSATERVFSARSRDRFQAALKIQRWWRRLREKRILSFYRSIIRQKLRFQGVAQVQDSLYQSTFREEHTFSSHNAPQAASESEQQAALELSKLKEFESRRWHQINQLIQQSLQGALNQNSLLQRLMERSQQNRRLIEEERYKLSQPSPELVQWPESEEKQVLRRYFKDSYQPPIQTKQLIRRASNPVPHAEEENQSDILDRLQKLRLDLTKEPDLTEQKSLHCSRKPHNEETATAIMDLLLAQFVREDHELIYQFYEEANPHGFDSSNQGAVTFCKLFLDFLLGRDFAPKIAEELSKPAGITARELLAIMQNGHDQFEESCPVIPYQNFSLFEELFFGDCDQPEAEYKLVFDKMLYEAVCELLELRKAQIEMPWWVRPTGRVSFSVSGLPLVFSDCLNKVSNFADRKMGLLPESCSQLNSRDLRKVREELLMAGLRQDLEEEEKQWQNVGDEVCELLLRLERTVLQTLLSQLVREF